MGKIASKYLKVHPFKIVEEGYHYERHMVSESLFSLSNEFMGVRAFFEEASDAASLRGTFFNGFYDYASKIHHSGYKGIPSRTHFMVNSPDFLKVKLVFDGKEFNFNEELIRNFYRELDFRTGLYTRSYIIKIAHNKEIKLIFERILDMEHPNLCQQRLTFEPIGEAAIDCELTFIIDHHIEHGGDGEHIEKLDDHAVYFTKFTHQLLRISDQLKINGKTTPHRHIKFAVKNDSYVFERTLFLDVKKELQALELYQDGKLHFQEPVFDSFDATLAHNKAFYQAVFETSDIEISGDDEDQQGIRYCIFQLANTYHGLSPHHNIGAKGLTGIAYSGHAFWDSETYCLPFYLFNNHEAAKNLILYRYNTLDAARKRARDLDCDGACFPIATLNGEEACDLWQHASCQFQPTTAVVYALWHYYMVTGDQELLLNEGLEIIIEACKFLLSRGQWDPTHQHFGFHGVMGPDEFKMFVSHNTYTNYMAKFAFEFLFELINDYHVDLTKYQINDGFVGEIKNAATHMVILYDPKTKLYEQHDGYYKMPHLDVDTIPVTDFPLYHHWTYDRIYRYDMIKQPDVLMFIFLFMSQFSLSVKQANYEFYEPRCIHESSLSPSVHSILASELGKDQEALDFFGFASRLDLDDYNRNTKEGLHLTSIAAAWLNVVYGFGGLRSDGKILVIAPKKPTRWSKYSFKILYQGAIIKVLVTSKEVSLKASKKVKIKIYDKLVTLKENVPYQTSL
ncbi:MAG: hypothetical protein LBR37_01125 [Erysipelotrichaceae bacterium]|jgi:maltose phosphorylase|nr:hypothetical protein [Erysipelotrichaceae bacterium]